MAGWATLFLTLAVIAGLFGFTRICGRSFLAARLVFAFLILLFLGAIVHILIHQP